MNRDRLSRLIYPTLGFLFFGFSLYILQQELDNYNLEDILSSLSLINKRQVFYAVFLTIIEYLVISSYDLISFYQLKCYLSIKRILFTTFITYAVSNTTGYTLLIGGGIRYRFYSFWGVATKDIAKIIALGNLTFWLGVLTLASITFITNPLQLPGSFDFDLLIMRCVGVVFLFLIGIYLYFCGIRKRLKIKQKTLLFPRLTTSISQIAIFSLDWAIAAAILYCLIPNYPGQTYFDFFSIYLLAMTTSIMSNVPGGIGIFETAIIFLLPHSLSASDILGSLLAYRGIRFLLPLATAIILVCCFEIRRRLTKSHKNIKSN
jgi:uncharacterized membrane protein YbhN (UPF0104 family)